MDWPVGTTCFAGHNYKTAPPDNRRESEPGRYARPMRRSRSENSRYAACRNMVPVGLFLQLFDYFFRLLDLPGNSISVSKERPDFGIASGKLARFLKLGDRLAVHSLLFVISTQHPMSHEK